MTLLPSIKLLRQLASETPKSVIESYKSRAKAVLCTVDQLYEKYRNVQKSYEELYARFENLSKRCSEDDQEFVAEYARIREKLKVRSKLVVASVDFLEPLQMLRNIELELVSYLGIKRIYPKDTAALIQEISTNVASLVPIFSLPVSGSGFLKAIESYLERDKRMLNLFGQVSEILECYEFMDQVERKLPRLCNRLLKSWKKKCEALSRLVNNLESSFTQNTEANRSC